MTIEIQMLKWQSYRFFFAIEIQFLSFGL